MKKKIAKENLYIGKILRRTMIYIPKYNKYETILYKINDTEYLDIENNISCTTNLDNLTFDTPLVLEINPIANNIDEEKILKKIYKMNG